MLLHKILYKKEVNVSSNTSELHIESQNNSEICDRVSDGASCAENAAIGNEIDKQTQDKMAKEVEETVQPNSVDNKEDKGDKNALINGVCDKDNDKKPAKPKKGFGKVFYLFFKRAFDIISSAIFLIAFSWLYCILAILVKCSDGGPVFYRHERVGKNGKTIYIPKFRSMKKNADKLEDMLTPEQLEKYKTEYKIDNDPRITKLGAFLRKTSLDELPNIWAIFTGSISVIGPRPIMRSEAQEKYGNDMEKLLSVKPGMIGWWAANGRNNSTYTTGERQKLELYYVDHCSFWLDVKIIFKTIGGVIKRTGAK